MTGPMLEGAKVVLRPLRDDDLPRRVAWLADPEIIRLFSGPDLNRVYGLPEVERWRVTTELDPITLVWAIDSEDGTHIGDVDLHNIGGHPRSAKLTILIGDKAYWSHGYGTDTVRTVLNYAFAHAAIDVVTLNVFDYNERAVRCYEKCGFRLIEPTWPGAPTPRNGELFMAVKKESFMAEHTDAHSIRA